MDTDKTNGSAVEPPITEVPMKAAHLAAEFTPEEWQVLASLRNRYQQGLDQFSERERAHLRFLQWLYHSGRLEA